MKKQPKVGKLYLVPCLRREDIHYRNVNGEWVEDEQGEYYLQRIVEEHYEYFIPIINHPHSDRENGQKEIHYHADFRFIPRSKSNLEVRVSELRPLKDDKDPIIYLILQCREVHQRAITHVSLISNSKLKHDCMYKGKCPHRGYDLSQEVPVDGVITCPLHGLKFEAGTGKVINHTNFKQ